MIGHILYLCGPVRLLGSQISSRRFFWDLSRYQKSLFKPCAKSSISEARAKLPWQAIRHLLSVSQVEDPKSQWKGHPVWAVDGTGARVPKSKELCQYFPARKSKEHYPRSRVTAAVNVLTGQAGYAEVGDIYTSEPAMLSKITPHFKPGSIVLLDRCFTGVRLWTELMNQELFFVNRLPIFSGKNGLSQKVLRSKGNDLILDHKGLRLRFIKGPQRKNKPRIIIVTNLLDSKKYGRKALLELYKSRWAIETFFKQLKERLNLMDFHAKTYNGIMQEIFASLLMMSLINGMIWLAGCKSSTHKINFAAASDAIWQHMHLFLSGHHLEKNNLRELRKLLKLIAAIQLKSRPGRCFPRISKQPESKWIKARRARNHVEKGHWKWSNVYR